MQCPKCTGNMYDNRAENDARLARGEKMRPDWKCKDKACDGVIWREKGAAAPKPAAPAAPAKAAYSAGPHIPAIDDEHPALPHEKLDHIFTVYKTCFKEAHTIARAAFGDDVADDTVAAMGATLLIAAQKAGV